MGITCLAAWQRSPFFASSVVGAQRAEAGHVSISDLQQHVVHYPVVNSTRQHSKSINIPPAGYANRIDTRTMQCITRERSADVSAYTRGGNLPDVLTQIELASTACLAWITLTCLIDETTHTHTHKHAHTNVPAHVEAAWSAACS